MNIINKSTKESAVRSRALRDGYRVRRSRREDHLNNHGEFMLLDLDNGFPVLGFQYDATLEEIAEFLST